MCDLKFRRASASDMAEISDIYESARAFMRETGNGSQWGDVYPPKELITSDIEGGNLYVAEADRIEAVFAFFFEADPTYDHIEGEWLNDLPYCAVHRVASAGRVRGMLSKIMDFCFLHCDNIKIDTHENNAVMQHQLEKYGFSCCGTVYLEK